MTHQKASGVMRVNDHMTVEFIGKATLIDGVPQTSDDGVQPERGRERADEMPADEAQYRQVAFNALNSSTLNQFELVIEQPLLTSVHEYQVERGLASGSEGVDSPRELEARTPPQDFRAEGLTTQGWSNGTDNRVLRSPTTLYPWCTIAQHGSGDSTCSSTLIGPRHLITAAHCINQRGTTNWYTVRVDPGRNGLNNSPYGSSTIKINPDPGTEAWYFTPSAWRSQWCVDNPYACNQWDWGMIVIPDRLGDMTGWMGYWAGPGSFLEQQTLYNRGYPMCSTDRPNKPALCNEDIYGQTYWARLWGDQDCNISHYLYKGSDNWNRVLKVDCDLSARHSGSPIYFYVNNANTNNQWVPVVTAVVTWEECFTCNSTTSHPNLVSHITPGDLNVISWLRNVFP
jgi:V8-like Glu-specific endopeptidase